MNRPNRLMARLFLSLATMVGLVLAGTVLTTAPAVAQEQQIPRECPNTEIDQHEAFSGQITVCVYYSSAAGGTNTAWAYKNVNVGTPEYLNVIIYRCATGNPNNPCNPTEAEQDPPPPGSAGWVEYSGPVDVTRTNGLCIQVGVMYRISGPLWWGPYHCR